MASLDIDEEPPPCSPAYNIRLTKEEHETLVSAETEKQLNSLLLHLEKNPKMFSEFLKKRKISEMERAGLFSNLKVKVLSAIYGKDFIGDIDLETCEEKLEEFESTTIKTYNNSQESKGRTHKFSHSQIRYSKRIAERQAKCSIPPPPPPPPLPMIIQGCSGEPKSRQALQEKAQPSNFKKDFNRKRTASTNTLQEEIKSMSKRIVKRRPLGQVSANSMRTTKQEKDEESCPFQRELMLARKKLRSVGLPDQTPYQVSKLRRGHEEQDENRFPLFNQELIRKFKNTRSSPRSPASNSNCSSPVGYEATP